MNQLQLTRFALTMGAVFCLSAVMIGAFGAHALKDLLDSNSKAIFETAVRYQMYHGLALLIVGILSNFPMYLNKWLSVSIWSFAFAIILFSGSLYALALGSPRWFGAITPLGGIGFIVGWLYFIICVWHAKLNINQSLE